MYTKEKIKKKWKNIGNDKYRVEWLRTEKDLIPEFTIHIDNDLVYVSFTDEDGCLIFDKYGYELLEDVFNSIGLNSELV